jgi:hypothetical protein
MIYVKTAESGGTVGRGFVGSQNVRYIMNEWYK